MSISGGRSKENQTIIGLYHVFENLRKNANGLKILIGHLKKLKIDILQSFTCKRQKKVKLIAEKQSKTKQKRNQDHYVLFGLIV